jgi:hypothetical protein
MMISSGSGMRVLLHPVPLVVRHIAIVHPKPVLQITHITLARSKPPRRRGFCGSAFLHHSPARRGCSSIALEQNERAGRIDTQVLQRQRHATRGTTMSAKRSKMTKEEEAALFQKATEALRSFW